MIFGKVRVGGIFAADGCLPKLSASYRDGRGKFGRSSAHYLCTTLRISSNAGSASHAWFPCAFSLCRALHVAMGAAVLDIVAGAAAASELPGLTCSRSKAGKAACHDQPSAGAESILCFRCAMLFQATHNMVPAAATGVTIMVVAMIAKEGTVTCLRRACIRTENLPHSSASQ